MSDNGKRLSIEDYQNALAGLTREELERLHRALADRLAGALTSSPARRSLLELDGLGVEIWRDIDAQEYVNHERDSWTS
jgi:hypothetical protein